ncbi:hypothetical protein [uncultured Azohydromonas sp.]|jgi:hypothetical protein|uniref:hypothetical protein n=1 Tax=uncultured Azohydromonas sp. TaxID=487342 RepID=UPI00261CD520|nr:hypothetical protein [uncultured Azohydromonas sp.]
MNSRTYAHAVPCLLLSLLGVSAHADDARPKPVYTQQWSVPSNTEARPAPTPQAPVTKDWAKPVYTQQWSAPPRSEARTGTTRQPTVTQEWSKPPQTQDWAKPVHTRKRTDAENQALVDQTVRNIEQRTRNANPNPTPAQLNNQARGQALVNEAYRRAHDRGVAAERAQHEADRRYYEERYRRDGY